MTDATKLPESDRHRVSITDIDMPFWSIVRFTVKWAVASIPAFVILTVLTVFAGVLCFGLATSLFSARSKNTETTPVAPMTATPHSRVADRTKELDESSQLKRMTASVSVKPVALANITRGFMNGIELQFVLENTAGKEIRAFEGKVNFKDVLAHDVDEIHLRVTKPLRAAEKRVPVQDEYMTSLEGKKLDELAPEWVPSKILFADGTTVTSKRVITSHETTVPRHAQD